MRPAGIQIGGGAQLETDGELSACCLEGGRRCERLPDGTGGEVELEIDGELPACGLEGGRRGARFPDW